MRFTIRIAGTAFVAVLVAACSAGASPSPSADRGDRPVVAAVGQRRSHALADAPTPARRTTSTLVTAGQAHDRHGQPGLPAVLPARRTAATRRRGRARATRRTAQGFESAVAYAVADKLGFAKDEVTWIAVKFDNAYAPGPKTFDFDINQVSYTPERAQAVDLSDGYYFLNQSLVAVGGHADRRGHDDRRSRRRTSSAPRSARRATTRSSNVIKPTKEPRVYDTQRRRDRGARRTSRSTASSSTCRRRSTSPPPRSTTAVDRRPVPADRRRRGALQPGAGQGQPADRLRQPGDRGDEGRRHARRDHQGVAAPTRRTRRSSSRSRSRARRTRPCRRVAGAATGRRDRPGAPTAPRRAGERRGAPLDARSPSPAPSSSSASLGWIVVNAPGLAGRPGGRSSTARSSPASLPSIVGSFWVNVQLFLIAEVLILVLGLVLAVLRSLPGPVFFPLRLLATVYVDVFRALPGRPGHLHPRLRDPRSRDRRASRSSRSSTRSSR